MNLYEAIERALALEQATCPLQSNVFAFEAARIALKTLRVQAEEKAPAGNVLHLWRLECRRLGICDSHKSKFAQHVASRERLDEKKVVKEAKQRFSPEWWEESIVQDIVYVGELHMIDGRPLYEST